MLVTISIPGRFRFNLNKCMLLKPYNPILAHFQNSGISDSLEIITNNSMKLICSHENILME